MNIPDKGPGIINMTGDFIGKNISKAVGVVGMGKVLASQEEGFLNKTLDGLNVPNDLVLFISTIEEKIHFLVDIGRKGGETTINEVIEGGKIFLEPTAEYIINVGNNFELFDDGLLKILSQNEELWGNMIDTLLAFISVGGIYVFLIPALLKLITYKDCPNLGQRARSKVMKKLKKIRGIKYDN